jgi:hypothetical protein
MNPRSRRSVLCPTGYGDQARSSRPSFSAAPREANARSRGEGAFNPLVPSSRANLSAGRLDAGLDIFHGGQAVTEPRPPSVGPFRFMLERWRN